MPGLILQHLTAGLAGDVPTLLAFVSVSADKYDSMLTAKCACTVEHSTSCLSLIKPCQTSTDKLLTA